MSSRREEEIKLEAKQILDKFARALEKVKAEEDFFVERDEDRRKESQEEKDSDFREIFFENAPSVKKECIEVEKGGWK